jgi:hypothetical protein
MLIYTYTGSYLVIVNLDGRIHVMKDAWTYMYAHIMCA